MGKFKVALNSFFSSIKWWEYLYMVLFYATIITCGVVFKSTALVIVSAIVCCTAIFFIAKGKVLGNILGIFQCILYSIVSYFNHFYGEIILCMGITLPIYIASIVTWIRNISKDEKVVKVNRMLKWQEWASMIAVVTVLSVGVYYLLQFLNTQNLIVSTINVSVSMIAGYLLIRRSEFSFIFFILNNIISIVLWSTVLAGGAIESVPTFVLFLIYLLLNIMGFINWLRFKNLQNKTNGQEEIK